MHTGGDSESCIQGAILNHTYWGDSISEVYERYLEVTKSFLIPVVDFYYIINKLIILVLYLH
jgi:hypothetical protein